MKTRKEYRVAGRKMFHRHFLLLVFLCLLLSLFGIEGGQSVQFLKLNTGTAKEEEVGSHLGSDDVFQEIASGNLGQGLQISNQILENTAENIGGIEALSLRRGVLASFVNSITAGRVHLKIAMLLRNLTKTDKGAAALFLTLRLILIIAVWLLVKNIYSAIMRRLFLEARLYDRVAPSEAFHFASVRKWFHASWSMCVYYFIMLLWTITIIGGIIMHYAYYAVPYIIAENPGIGPIKALRLSRKMMYGHKMEAFKLDFSYIGWLILSVVTFGVSDLAYGLPYRIAGRTEYYADIRALAKETAVEGVEQLDDKYLFEKGDKILLYETYFDVVDKQTYVHENQIVLGKGRAFASKWFGLWLGKLEDKKKYEELEGIKYQMYYDERSRDGRAYPFRLNPRFRKSRLKIKPLNFLRSYSVWTILIFLVFFAFVGWCWEVGLYFSRGMGFVNRGVLHGPWLPIYGVGGLIALLLCSRFRKHPVREFFFAVTLCGVLEYFGAYFLETKYHEKWWSYEGNFLNLHGRICAEGLIVFGIACMLVVYLIAPVADILLSKLPKKLLIVIAVALAGIFLTDLFYSLKHPNVVPGAIETHEEVQTEDGAPPETQEKSDSAPSEEETDDETEDEAA